MKAHLEALRRDLERPGRVGLYLAGREHPELEPLIARQAEQWHDALALSPDVVARPTPGRAHRVGEGGMGLNAAVLRLVRGGNGD